VGGACNISEDIVVLIHSAESEAAAGLDESTVKNLQERLSQETGEGRWNGLPVKSGHYIDMAMLQRDNPEHRFIFFDELRFEPAYRRSASSY
jgi:hypothetical protein